MGLHQYADRFAKAGLAAFAFDYRTFGGSDGEPRNWISPRRHLDDWRAALDYVTNTLGGRGAIDAGRVGLWGTSYGGGHALVMAGERPGNISAVVAQVPFLDGKEALGRMLKTKGPVSLLRRAAAGEKGGWDLSRVFWQDASE
jgi:dienelactone hydrolase